MNRMLLVVVLVGLLAACAPGAVGPAAGSGSAGAGPEQQCAARSAVTIPDEQLHTAVRTILDLGSAEVTCADLAGLTRLSVMSAGITDLSGLEHATNLQTLHLLGNQISDLTPLAGLLKLHDLNLYGNQVSDLSPLAELPNLEILSLVNNQVSDVSPLAGLLSLRTLWLAGNPVADYGPVRELPLTTFQLSGVTGELTNEFVDRDELTALYVWVEEGHEEAVLAAASSMPNLTTLSFLSNSEAVIDTAPLTALTGLETLFFQAEADSVQNIATLTGLTNLYVRVTGSVAPLRALTHLKQLMLTGSAPTDLEVLAELPQLTHLELAATGISDLSFLAGHPALQRLDIGSNRLRDVKPLLGIASLSHVTLNDNCLGMSVEAREQSGVAALQQLIGHRQVTGALRQRTSC